MVEQRRLAAAEEAGEDGDGHTVVARGGGDDFEAGARVAGQKFYYLRNEAVLLDLALQHYALSVAQRHGFTLHVTPDLARESVLDGLGFNPRGESSQIYSVANSDLCLVGTAEITLGGMLADQILEAERLPLKLAGLSHCFRTEAGSHGQESRGLYRVHQFTKVELFVFTEGDLEHSEAMHRNLLDIEEEVFQGLGLPYRVLDIASGDLGGPAYRKYDIEAWMPGRGDFGEVTSTSNCTDYQSRRLKIRYREPSEDGRKNKPRFVHMLNGTAVATSRAQSRQGAGLGRSAPYIRATRLAISTTTSHGRALLPTAPSASASKTPRGTCCRWTARGTTPTGAGARGTGICACRRARGSRRAKARSRWTTP